MGLHGQPPIDSQGFARTVQSVLLRSKMNYRVLLQLCRRQHGSGQPASSVTSGSRGRILRAKAAQQRVSFIPHDLPAARALRAIQKEEGGQGRWYANDEDIVPISTEHHKLFLGRSTSRATDMMPDLQDGANSPA